MCVAYVLSVVSSSHCFFVSFFTIHFLSPEYIHIIHNINIPGHVTLETLRDPIALTSLSSSCCILDIHFMERECIFNTRREQSKKRGHVPPPRTFRALYHPSSPICYSQCEFHVHMYMYLLTSNIVLKKRCDAMMNQPSLHFAASSTLTSFIVKLTVVSSLLLSRNGVGFLLS